MAIPGKRNFDQNPRIGAILEHIGTVECPEEQATKLEADLENAKAQQPCIAML